MEKITIGGKEHTVRLLVDDVDQIMNKFNQLYSDQKHNPKVLSGIDNIKKLYADKRERLQANRKDEIITEEEYKYALKLTYLDEATAINAVEMAVPQKYFFWAIWKLLVKSGIWPFRKPYRSLRHLRRNLEIGDGIGIIQFVGTRILGFKVTDETDKKKVEVRH